MTLSNLLIEEIDTFVRQYELQEDERYKWITDMIVMEYIQQKTLLPQERFEASVYYLERTGRRYSKYMNE